MAVEWINLYELAKLSGLVYFAALVDASTNKAVGWVSRAGIVEPYSYSCVYADATNNALTTRGTWDHAQACVWGLHNSFAQPAQIAMAIVQRAAQDWNISSVEIGGDITTARHAQTFLVESRITGTVLASSPRLWLAMLEAFTRGD